MIKYTYNSEKKGKTVQILKNSIAGLLVAIATTFSLIAHAQEWKPYEDAVGDFDAGSAVNYGFTPNVPGSFLRDSENGTAKIDFDENIMDKQSDEIEKLAGMMVGCAAIDQDDVMKSVIDEGLQDWDEYTETPGWKDIVTTVFGDAQAPMMFNSLENYAYHRAKMATDRCAALQQNDPTGAVVWEGVQKCVDEYVGTEATAERFSAAYLHCLNNPFESSTGDTTLIETVQDSLNSQRWAGSLHDALTRTNYCLRNHGEENETEACYLLSFVPNVRWCVQGKININGECSNSDGSPISGQGAMSVPESIAPQAIFDLAFKLSEPIVKYQYEVARTLDATIDAQRIAHIGEFGPAAVVMNNVLEDEGTGDTYRYSQIAANALRDSTSYLLGDFHRHTSCTSQGIGPDFEAYLYFAIDKTTNPRTKQQLQNALDNLNEHTFSRQGVRNYFSQKHDAMIENLTNGFAVSSDLYDVKQALRLVASSTLCSSLHDLRLSLGDYLKFTGSEEAGAALLAYRGQLAYMATLRVMDYIRYRLQMSRVQMSFSHLSDPNGFTPHMRQGLDHLIDAYNGRIQGLKERGEHQKSFANAFSSMKFTRDK